MIKSNLFFTKNSSSTKSVDKLEIKANLSSTVDRGGVPGAK